MRIEIWHNVLWSRYKGRVFSALHALALSRGEDVRFVQMAETTSDRIALAAVDLSYHDYPFELLYRGAADDVSAWRTVPRYFWRGLTSQADFTVIAGYAEPQNWAQLAGLMLRGQPRGVFCDSTLGESRPGRTRAWAKRFFFRRADVIFYYGERARAMALHFGARPGTLVRRHQVAALPDTYDARAVPALRAAAKSATPRFLYVGRLVPEKNLSRLLAGFARFRANHRDARLRLAGDGPLRDALATEARTLGIAEAVGFLGGLDQEALGREYLAATALVLPSLREPWGIVVNEALAYGCPVLVSERCGCVPELVIAHVSGSTFDPENVEALKLGLAVMNSDAAPSATSCLHLIDDYTPDVAARNILDGIGDFFARAPTGTA